MNLVGKYINIIHVNISEDKKIVDVYKTRKDWSYIFLCCCRDKGTVAVTMCDFAEGGGGVVVKGGVVLCFGRQTDRHGGVREGEHLL